MKVSKIEELEVMINSLPPSLDLLKKGLLAKVREISNEYVLSSTSISWGIKDFEHQAQELESLYDTRRYDRSRFQDTLEMMIMKHDSSIGISWEVIQMYLNDYCLIVNRKVW